MQADNLQKRGDNLEKRALTESELFPKGYIKRLLVPLIIEQFLGITIGLADAIMVSSAGEAAISGVSLVDQINVLLMQTFSALSTGGAVVVSQYMGRNERKNACKAAKQLFLVSTAVASVIAVICMLFCPNILSAIFGSVENDVMKNCQTYFYVSVISYPFLALYNSGAAIYRSIGKSRVIMVVSVIMNTVNMIGNAITIFGLGLGVLGAALATLVSRALGGIVMTVMAYNKKNPVYVSGLWKIRFDMGYIKRILYIGVPNGIEGSMFQVGKLMVARVVAFLGTASIAANSVAGTVASISNVPGMAVGLALVTIVGQSMGAGLVKTAEKYTKKMLGLTFLLMNALNVIILIFAPQIVSLYTEISPQAASDAVRIIRVFCLVSSVSWPLAFTLPNCLRASGDVKFTLAVSMASMWLCRVALCYLLCYRFGFGIDGVWYAMYADWVVRLIFFVIRFIHGKWKTFKVI